MSKRVGTDSLNHQRLVVSLEQGFSMYDTNTDVHDCWDLTGKEAAIKPCCTEPGCRFPYSSKQAFGRDVAGELVAAARKGGVCCTTIDALHLHHHTHTHTHTRTHAHTLLHHTLVCENRTMSLSQFTSSDNTLIFCQVALSQLLMC